MRSMRLKLILASFVIVFLPVFLLNRYALQAFDRFTRGALEEEMISHARMLGEQYRLAVIETDARRREGALHSLAWVVQQTAKQAQSRFRLLSPAGAVLLDSDPQALTDASQAFRDAVAAAVAGQYGARWELTPDGRFVFYHIAWPVKDQGRVLGVVAIARHTAPIIRAILRMKNDQRRAMLLALAFAAVVAAVLAQTMTRRLRRLTRASADFAKGYAPFELTVRGRDEIGELGRAVQSMAAELERRNRYNREFVSILLHELKTPLTSIKGASELLEGTASDKPDARQKFLANIRFEAERMIRMVGELAELTRLDTDTAPARRVRADYPALVREIVERLEPGLDPGHAPISVAVPEKPIHVRAAPDRIEQLLANLLDNAIRHTPPDGAIQVTVEEGPAGCVITRVKDTGCGIPAANLAKVFDPFFTTVPRDKPLDYGSGLGLAIARSIVENHHGRLSVESEPGHGATFIVTLPLDSG